MRETTAAFVHTGDVEGPVARHVTGDLRVADEGASVGHRYRAAPRAAVVSGAAHDQGTRTHGKVVPGNIHVPEEGRTGVVIGPARLAVVAAARVNAKMRPAVWIVRSGGLVSAQGAARVSIDPDSEPSAARLVVDNNRIAKGIGKGATTAAIGHAGEGQSAVVGNRQGREVAAVRASGVVVGGQYLVRGIRVSPSVCLRLNNVRRSLRPSNQVHVRAAISQGGRQVFHKPGERTGSATFVSFAASFGLAAENHN